MSERREMGALEHEVLSELWSLGEPAILPYSGSFASIDEVIEGA